MLYYYHYFIIFIFIFLKTFDIKDPKGKKLRLKTAEWPVVRAVDWEGIMQKHRLELKTLNRQRDSFKKEQNLSVIGWNMRDSATYRSLGKSNVAELNGPSFFQLTKAEKITVLSEIGVF